MKYTKAEVDIIVLENVDIVTSSVCPDLVWEEGYKAYNTACGSGAAGGWKQSCGDANLSAYKYWERGKGWDKK